MAGNPLGAAKTAAGKIGCTAEEYVAQREAGNRWCIRCRSWLPVAVFRRHRARPDGLGCECGPCGAARKRQKTAERRAKRAEFW